MTTSDYVLLAYIFIIVPAMLVGFVFARRQMFVPYHKITMTTITIVNWILIITVMVVTYGRDVAPQLPQNLKFSEVFIPTLHLLTGLTAQLIATYLVIRMWFENQLPEWFKVQNIKLFMRTTLVLWLLTALLGLTVWAVFYQDFLSSPPSAAVAPSSSGVPTVQLVSGNKFSPTEITVAAGSTVHFISADSKKHTVTADDGSFASGDLTSGKTFDFTPLKPGDYRFYCEYHGDKGGVGMSGIIHVTGSAVSGAAGSVSASPTTAPASAVTAEATTTSKNTTASTPAVTEEATTQPVKTEQATTAAQNTSQNVAPSTANTTASVSLKDDDFDPTTMTITAGTTVTFTNTGKHKHTVTADDGSFDSDQLTAGKTYTLKFDKPGKIALYCQNHGDKGGQGMSMVINVVAASASAQVAQATAAPIQTEEATTQPVKTEEVTSAPIKTEEATSQPIKTEEATQAVAGLQSAMQPLVVSATDTPNQVAYVVGLQSQTEIVVAQAQAAVAALQVAHYEDAQAAAEAIMNTIAGNPGKDLDQDGKVNQPGDGYGLQSYVYSVNEGLDTASTASDASATVKSSATDMETTGRTILTDLQAVSKQAQALLDAKTLVDARKVSQPLSDAVTTLNADASKVISGAATMNIPGSTITETPTAPATSTAP